MKVHASPISVASQKNDDFACDSTPVCGKSCPAFVDVACGDKNPHLLKVFEIHGAAGCVGGGYELTVEVQDKNGVTLAPKKVQLGGGPKRKIPKWLDPDKVRQRGSLLDDEQIW